MHNIFYLPWILFETFRVIATYWKTIHSVQDRTRLFPLFNGQWKLTHSKLTNKYLSVCCPLSAPPLLIQLCDDYLSIQSPVSTQCQAGAEGNCIIAPRLEVVMSSQSLSHSHEPQLALTSLNQSQLELSSSTCFVVPYPQFLFCPTSLWYPAAVRGSLRNISSSLSVTTYYLPTQNWARGSLGLSGFSHSFSEADSLCWGSPTPHSLAAAKSSNGKCQNQTPDLYKSTGK